MKRLIIITGQTATGKTKLALEYAKKYNGELINCDSRQIYKKLNIITGKDTDHSKFELVDKINNFDIGFYCFKRLTLNAMPRGRRVERLTKIWLYDIVDPKQYFSSFDYKECALNVIGRLEQEGKTPIIVGGTYFYLYHLLYGVASETIPPNWQLRNELNNKPIEELQKILKKLSLHSFEKLNQSDKNNPQRLIRRIEIIQNKLAGKLTSEVRGQQPRMIETSEVEVIGLRFKNKDDLRQAIKSRVEKRLSEGAIDEVKKLLKEGYSEKDPGLKTIGYNQIIRFLKGEISWEKAIEEWITREVQYAKRQYTFMKKDPNIRWQEV